MKEQEFSRMFYKLYFEFLEDTEQTTVSAGHILFSDFVLWLGGKF